MTCRHPKVKDVNSSSEPSGAIAVVLLIIRSMLLNYSEKDSSLQVMYELLSCSHSQP